jgi:hypothetical protein
MKSVVIVSAGLLALLGFLVSATSPNPSDHLAGKILIAIAVGFALLALYAPPKMTAAVYFGAIVLTILAYSLPMSFWRSVGLAKEQPTNQRDPRHPTRDR